MGDGNKHNYVVLPCITSKMQATGATNQSLADACGICHCTVQRAKNGKRIHLNLGIAMYQALNTRAFTRSPCGAKT